ncbi:MAG TPA: hypothetical protein VFD62_17260 [Pyrinomonadaceae bacterium]|nr:hypothetical protein [Pyrinomonadaceae bacterium]
MSKKFSSALVLLLLVCLVAGSFLPVVSGQTGATRTAQNASIISTAEAILKETSELRELSILREVKSGAQSRSEIEQVIIKNLDADTTPAEMYAAEIVLKAFGLAPLDFAYRSFLIKLLSEQVAGYYDPKARQFYLADWIELDGQKPVMAHELTHALQDQHFNLRRFEKWPDGDSDAELAARALIEGDATLAMTHYLTRHPMVALAFMRSSQDTPSEQFEKAPRAVRESLMFPYAEGSNWAAEVHDRGGWDMVSKAFTKLPQSTEQILHPEKYFAYEPPVKVTLPDFRRALGPRWKRIDNDVSGEWGYYLVLDEYLKDAKWSKKAAAGWGGDRFVIYEGPRKSGVFLAQLTVWDTAADAEEFLAAYTRRIVKRLGDLSAIQAGTSDGEVQRSAWKDPIGGGGAIEKRGSRVVILEGVPAKANVNQLLNMIWQQPQSRTR